jgi:hypothetical protein
MTDPAFDYRAYRPLVPPRLRPPAHQRPQLVFSQPDIPPRPDELTQQLGRIRNSLVLIRQSSAEASAILWRRFLDWCDAHILRSLTSAWVIAGVGWGGCIVFPAVLYFTR